MWCLIFCVCNRVKSYCVRQFTMQTCSTDMNYNHQQVTRIFWNKRFAKIIKGLKYFVFIIINNRSLRYVLTAMNFSLLWICKNTNDVNWAYFWLYSGCTYFVNVYALDLCTDWEFQRVKQISYATCSNALKISQAAFECFQILEGSC